MSIATDGDLRTLYHDLERDVSRAVNIPTRSAALPNHIPNIRLRVLDFVDTAARVCLPFIRQLIELY